MTNGTACPYCQSPEIVKFGLFEGIQRYWCKACKRKFTLTGALPKMKTPKRVIASALSCYYSGMSLDGVQRHLQQQFGIYLSEAGIYNWIIRFSREAVKHSKDFRPAVGSTWIADETMIDVAGRKVWFWDIIDTRSRYLLASHLSTTRSTKDAALLMHKAATRAGKPPRKVITDRLAVYLDGIELVFGADTKHVQSKPFTVVDSTNMIERFHGTLKDRTKVVRGFKNMETARLLTEAWLVHYNFFKEHESLGHTPPAQKMRLPLPFDDWAGVLDNVERDMLAGTPRPEPPPQHRPVVHTYAKTQPKRKRKPATRGSISPTLGQIR